MKFTLFLVVDDRHLSELCLSMPTWLVFHKEIMDMSVLLVHDESVSEDDIRIEWIVDLWKNFGGASNFKFVKWPDRDHGYRSHREKMLSAYVHAVNHIDTEWFLKIDTDAISIDGTSLYDKEWFDGDNVFISIPGGFNRGLIISMERWAVTHPELSLYPKIEPFDISGRMYSWVMFGNTGVCRNFSKLVPSPMKIPSQDVYHSYLTKKMGLSIMGVDFPSRGWRHNLPRLRGLTDRPEDEMYNPLFLDAMKLTNEHIDYEKIYDKVKFLLGG